MKKVLSFVLVLAMILGSVSMVFATTALPFEDAPNSKLATVLRDLGVLKGSDGKVFLDTPVSRAEICAILMRVLGYEDYCTADYAINGASSFSDVEPGTWYNGYVNVAAQLGYVDGIGGGQFNPTGNVGLNDGVAFVMKALGYSADHLLLDWPYNFLVPAQTMGLLEGVDTKAVELTRQDMFTILYNALEEPFVTWEYANVLKPELGGKFVQVTKTATAADTFAEAASGDKNLAALSTIYTTDSAFVKEEGFVKGFVGFDLANDDFDYSAYVGKQVIVLLSNGDVLAVLGEDSKITTEIEYNKSKVATTIAGLAISGTAVTENTTFYRNGEELSKASHDAISAPYTSAVALAKGVDWEVEYGTVKNAKKVEFVDTVYSVAYETIDKYEVVGKVQAATLAALTKGAFAQGELVFSGSSILTEVRGAAASVDEIKEGDVIELYYNYDGSKILIINVVRDDVEGVILTSYVGNKYSFSNGKTYETFGTTELNEVIATELHWVSPVALKLNSDGEIVYATVEGISEVEVVPEVTTGYAFVVYQLEDAAYTYTAKGPVVATSCALALMPFGETEALVFEAVSVAGLTTVNGWVSGKTFASAADVEYAVSADGKLINVSASGLGISYGSDQKIANGKIGSKYIASDVVIVKTTSVATSIAAAYGTYTLAELEGQTVSAFVIDNTVGAAKTIIVKNIVSAAPSTDKTYVSPAALLSWTGKDKNGTIVSYFDGEVKSAYATGNAAGLLDTGATPTNTAIYTVEFDKATGKITSVEALSTTKVLSSPVAITISAVAGSVEAIQTSNTSLLDLFYVDAPTVWVLTDEGFVAGTEATLEKNIDEYFTESISFYQVGNLAAGTYNFVVIK